MIFAYLCNTKLLNWMSVIREILNGNKRLFAFWMVLFFLFAGLFKSFAAAKTISSVHKKEQSSGSYVIAETDENRFDELKAFDFDSDDFEFALFGEFTSHKFYTAVKVNKAPAFLITYKNVYTLPLYDLFCNWKLHFS